MMMIEGAASRIQSVVQVLGGKFMTSPEPAAVEAEAGLPPRSLYVRGRSAVLGDVPPKVAAELFGIFPHWLFEYVLPPAAAVLDAPAAVRAYSESSARRSRVNLSAVSEPGRLAELLFRAIDAADAGGLEERAAPHGGRRTGRLRADGLPRAARRPALRGAASRGTVGPGGRDRRPRGRPRPAAAHGVTGGTARRP
ncbi:hypothetical protein GCM10027258_15080 [Amycolatopsis stemonae]